MQEIHSEPVPRICYACSPPVPRICQAGAKLVPSRCQGYAVPRMLNRSQSICLLPSKQQAYFLKTAASVLTFKLWPPLVDCSATGFEFTTSLYSPLLCFQNSKRFESTVIAATSFKHFMSCVLKVAFDVSWFPKCLLLAYLAKFLGTPKLSNRWLFSLL